MRTSALLCLVCVALLAIFTQAHPFVYRPYKLPKMQDASGYYLPMAKRSNAELINGLIGMDLNTLQAVGKRSNAELINGLIGMDLNRLSSIGRR